MAMIKRFSSLAIIGAVAAFAVLSLDYGSDVNKSQINLSSIDTSFANFLSKFGKQY